MPHLLYEDDELLAVDKPAGLATIPERFHSQCLLNTLQDAAGKKLFVVHRLDKETSGIVLFAKNADAHRYLNNLFSSHEIAKHYVAVVHNEMAKKEGLIEQPIRQFGSGRMGVDFSKGHPSATRYAVRKRSPAYTLVDVFPITGRRHQIRVHLYSIGHPVAGDPLYGSPGREEDYPRLMLHALDISFTHQNGERLTLAAALPEIFSARTFGGKKEKQHEIAAGAHNP